MFKLILFILLFNFLIINSEEICYHSRLLKDENNSPIQRSPSLNQHFHSMKWVDPDVTSWSCIDGRGVYNELGTLGGDSGEFIIGLGAYSRVTKGKLLKQSDIYQLLVQFINFEPKRSKFYYHTDDFAMSKLMLNLTNSGIDVSNLDIWNPPASLKGKLLERLVNPKYIGCSHIRQMLINPSDYLIPRYLIQNFIKSYFQILWDSPNSLLFKRDTFIQLHGNNNEISHIEIQINRTNVINNDICKILVPTSIPSDKEDSVSTIHSDEIINQGIRGRVKRFFKNQLSDPSQKQLLESTIDNIAKQQKINSFERMGISLIPNFYQTFKIYSKWTDVPSDELPDLFAITNDKTYEISKKLQIQNKLS